ncbi:MAG: FtsX-like permease family protein [Bacteroidota bacterium]
MPDSNTRIQQLSEQRLHDVFIIFSFIAMLIACMGLFGLVTFSSERRKKELSIRKLFGATIGNIVMLVSSEIVTLLFVSILIAVPAALYFSREWLTGFFYHAEISVTTIALPVIVALSIALIVIMIQGMKTALTDPAKNLKND